MKRSPHGEVRSGSESSRTKRTGGGGDQVRWRERGTTPGGWLTAKGGGGCGMGAEGWLDQNRLLAPTRQDAFSFSSTRAAATPPYPISTRLVPDHATDNWYFWSTRTLAVSFSRPSLASPSGQHRVQATSMLARRPREKTARRSDPRPVSALCNGLVLYFWSACGVGSDWLEAAGEKRQAPFANPSSLPRPSRMRWSS
jgi:hypothetical protein